MGQRLARRQPLAVCALSCLIGLAGCDHFDVREAASHLPPYQTAVDTPKTIIDTALDHCPDKTEEQEATCVKQALAERHLGVAALVAMIPGCRAGSTCDYRHTTEDRLGYVPQIAEDFLARWTVAFDLRHPVKDAADVPISVQQE